MTNTLCSFNSCIPVINSKCLILSSYYQAFSFSFQTHSLQPLWWFACTCCPCALLIFNLLFVSFSLNVCLLSLDVFFSYWRAAWVNFASRFLTYSLKLCSSIPCCSSTLISPLPPSSFRTCKRCTFDHGYCTPYMFQRFLVFWSIMSVLYGPVDDTYTISKNTAQVYTVLVRLPKFSFDRRIYAAACNTQWLSSFSSPAVLYHPLQVYPDTYRHL